METLLNLKRLAESEATAGGLFSSSPKTLKPTKLEIWIPFTLSVQYLSLTSFFHFQLTLYARSVMAASVPPSSTGSTKLDAVVQNASAKTPEKLSGLALYSRFALAGAVCCSVTHGGLTPVDV